MKLNEINLKNNGAGELTFPSHKLYRRVEVLFSVVPLNGSFFPESTENRADAARYCSLLSGIRAHPATTSAPVFRPSLHARRIDLTEGSAQGCIQDGVCRVVEN